MRICVLGLGYIGLPTASLFAASGYDVIGVDINVNTIKKLNEGVLPFSEPGLDELFEAAKPNFSAKLAVEESDVFLIAVPTPLDKDAKVADLKPVRLAAEMIHPVLRKGNLVILESTVPPGTSEHLVIPILEKSRLKLGEFNVAHCPERAIPGKTLHEMVNNDRIIGGSNEIAESFTESLYKSFVKGNIYLTNLRTAEFVKLMENTYRDVNIALANEFAQVSEEYDINVWEAIELANKHPRVEILKPGPGVGGHCIAIDPWFLTENSTKCKMISLARDINDSMPNYVMQMIRNFLRDVYGANITIFGVAYKGNIDDKRETPALKLIKLASNEGYAVKCFDPYVKNFEYPLYSLEEATAGSDCLVIIADHDLFKDIDPSKIIMRNKNIIDTRNILDMKKWERAGFKIRSLGHEIRCYSSSFNYLSDKLEQQSTP